MQKIVKVRRLSNPRRKKRNPTRVLTLGAKNPRRKTMATRRRRRRTASTVTRRRRRQTVAAAPVRRRRRNPVSVRRRRRRNPTTTTIRSRRRVTIRRRRRNPNLFGRNVSTTQMGQAILGGLVGVAATKMIPTFLPANFTGTPIMAALASGASAVVAGMVGSRLSQPFGDAVLFGGLMQTGSVLLNAFLPSVGGHIALRGGLGELVQGAFVVPQNPLNPMAANYPAYGRPMAITDASYGSGAPVTMNGVARAFGRAF